MPNWCVTNYTIVGKKSDIDKIANALENHPVMERSSDNWQGNILNALGVSYEEIKKRSMRGFLSEHNYIGAINDEESQLNMVFDEAWSRTEFADMLNKAFPDILIYWVAEEPGMGIYETNDMCGRFYPERFFVDTCINGEFKSEYFEYENEVYGWLEKISGCKDEGDVETFNENCMKYQLDDFIYVHEYDVV